MLSARYNALWEFSSAVKQNKWLTPWMVHNLPHTRRQRGQRSPTWACSCLWCCGGGCCSRRTGVPETRQTSASSAHYPTLLRSSSSLQRKKIIIRSEEKTKLRGFNVIFNVLWYSAPSLHQEYLNFHKCFKNQKYSTQNLKQFSGVQESLEKTHEKIS